MYISNNYETDNFDINREVTSKKIASDMHLTALFNCDIDRIATFAVKDGNEWSYTTDIYIGEKHFHSSEYGAYQRAVDFINELGKETYFND